ncbi:MAG: DUF5668 domain-containing protein [Anaerosomatales bacterium]|nr:DUF5668 domain-containing protein [Anaerosomatales bacterium]
MTLKRVFEGLTLVLIGVILLLNTTGSLPWSVWWHVLSLWPLLLVAAGLDIVAKGIDAPWLRVVSSLLIIGGLLVGAFVLPIGDATSGFGWFTPMRGTDFDIVKTATQRVDSGRAVIQGGVGSYRVTDGDEIVRVTGRSPRGEPSVDVTQDGRRVTVRVTGPEAERVWIPGMRGTSSMDVRLADSIPWDVEIDTGVVDLDADLADLTVTSLDVRSGVSQVTITLGEVVHGAGEIPVSVRGGVADFTVRVPRDTPVRVDAEAGLTNVSVDNDIPRVSGGGRTWMTSGYPDSGGYHISFEAGVSNVGVSTY